ncbi:hypothetical protein FGRMN_2146 [Fusarium graminum]|nr:hypothetical protein FGRMN_2146 [Fusarium graminum]
MKTVQSEFDRDFSFLRFQDESGFEQHDPIAVKRNAYWCYCGPLLDTETNSCLPASFSEFESGTLTGSVRSRFVSFLNYINNFLIAKGISHYFLTIRATTPTHEFDHPRWHTDELFFAKAPKGFLPGTRLGLKSQRGQRDKTGTNWKICTTLLGPSTLFIPLDHQPSARERQKTARQAASTDHECLSLRCAGCASAADAVRNELTTTLEPFGTVAAAAGECSVFQLGSDHGAMHSEPCLSCEASGRIFVNVIPGTEDELETLMVKWGMEFPRQWWVGGR